MACPMPMPSSTDSHFVDPLGSAARQKEPWSRSKCGCVFFFSDEDRDEKLDTGNMCKDIYRVICICNYIITFTIYTYDMVILYLQCKKERQQYKEYCCMPFPEQKILPGLVQWLWQSGRVACILYVRNFMKLTATRSLVFVIKSTGPK